MSILTSQSEPVRPDCQPAGPECLPRYRSWHDALGDAIRTPAELCRVLELPAEFAARAEAACGNFPMLVPRSLAARMIKGDPSDPLLRQVLPIPEETDDVPGFIVDPVDDCRAAVEFGLLQKYRGRVLLVTTGACAVHCRYCFRRHFPYSAVPKSVSAWQPALDAIARDESIHEVILSGGDPLTLVDSLLAELAEQIAAIPHVRRLRLHTRLPVVLPDRIDHELLNWLTGTRLTPIVVIHANHANELMRDAPVAVAALVDAGIPVLNQAVLLHGVNDSVEAQAALCERLVDLRVVPYYLHLLDRVAGAAHFEVPADLGREIIEQLRTLLPGYAVPRFVQEVPGESSKVIVG